MSILLWTGTILGAAIGLAHAVYLWRTTRQGTGGAGVALYRGVWALALWTLFGTYVLVLWIIGVIGVALTGRLTGRRGA